MPSTVAIVTWLFVATSATRVVAYLPQIFAAAAARDGARSVSRLTWGYFALAHLCGVAYSRAVLGDRRMSSALLGNALACLALVGIVTWKRWRFARAARAPASPAAPAPLAEPVTQGSAG